MSELRHLVVEAIFYAKKKETTYEERMVDYFGGKNKHDDPENFEPPVGCSPLHWLYGKEYCEPVGLPPGEWHQPEWDECMERWVYTVKENAYNIPEEAWQKFADRYDYLSEESNPNMGILGAWPEGFVGLRPSLCWTNDGMEWNGGGWTPVMYVTVYVTAIEEEFRAHPERFYGFELVESERN